MLNLYYPSDFVFEPDKARIKIQIPYSLVENNTDHVCFIYNSTLYDICLSYISRYNVIPKKYYLSNYNMKER